MSETWIASESLPIYTRRELNKKNSLEYITERRGLSAVGWGLAGLGKRRGRH